MGTKQKQLKSRVINNKEPHAHQLFCCCLNNCRHVYLLVCHKQLEITAFNITYWKLLIPLIKKNTYYTSHHILFLLSLKFPTNTEKNRLSPLFLLYITSVDSTVPTYCLFKINAQQTESHLFITNKLEELLPFNKKQNKKINEKKKLNYYLKQSPAFVCVFLRKVRNRWAVQVLFICCK